MMSKILLRLFAFALLLVDLYIVLYPGWFYHQQNKHVSWIISFFYHNGLALAMKTPNPFLDRNFIAFFGLMGCVVFILSIATKHTVGTSHGSARFATFWEALTYTWSLWLTMSLLVLHLLKRPLPARARASWLILGKYRGLTIALSEKQQTENVFVAAPIGSGKSSLIFLPNLLREQGSRSLFITDLKGELFDITAGAIARQHQIWLFQPLRPHESHGYNPLAHIHTVVHAQQFADLWITNTGEGSEPYWGNNARLLITALVMHLRVVEPNAPLSRLSDIITGTPFDDLKSLLSTSPSKHARRESKGFLDFMAKNDRLIGSTMTDIGNRFQVMADDAIRQVTAIDAIDFKAFMDEPTAFYVSVPREETRRLRPLLACLTAQLFTSWERRAQDNPGRTLARGIACYLDEFTNIGYIPGFDDFISSARSKGIAILVAIQSFSQLDKRYGEEAATTIKDCSVTHLVLTGAGKNETEYYSERIGDTTVATKSHTLRGNPEGGSQASMTQGETRRRLLTPDEIRTMRKNTILMLSKSAYPMLIKAKPYYLDRRLKRLINIPYHIKPMMQASPVPPPPAAAKASQPIIVESDAGNTQHYLQDE